MFFLIGPVEGIDLTPEQIWSEQQAGNEPIGKILGRQVYLRDDLDNRTKVVMEGDEGMDVGKDYPVMSRVLEYFESRLRAEQRPDLANIVRGVRLCHENMQLFASIQPQPELSAK